MTLTLNTHVHLFTQLVVCIYQHSGHGLQYFLKNHRLSHPNAAQFSPYRRHVQCSRHRDACLGKEVKGRDGGGWQAVALERASVGRQFGK